MEQQHVPGDPPLGREVREKAVGIALLWIASSYTQGQLALTPIPETWESIAILVASCLFVNLVNMFSGAFMIIYLFIEWAEYEKATSART